MSIARIARIAAAALTLTLAAGSARAGETDAPALIEKARAAWALEGNRAIRRLVASDRAAAYEAAHRLADSDAPEDVKLADRLAGSYAEVYDDPRLLERVGVLGSRTSQQRTSHAEARKLKESAIEAYGDSMLDEAREMFQRALEAFRDIGDLREEGRCLSNLAAVAAVKGESAAALDLLDDALAVVERAGDLDMLGAIQINRAYALGDLGRQDEEKTALQEAVASARQLGDRPGEARAILMLGGVDLGAGRLAEAEEQIRQAIDAARELDDPEVESVAWFNMSRVEHQRGHAAAEERALRRSLEAARRGDHPSMEADALLSLSGLARRRGDLASARALLAQARAVAARTEDDSLRSGVEYEEAKLWMAEGMYAESLSYFDAAEAWLKGTDLQGQLGAVLGGRANALYYAGQYEAAISYLRRSLEAAEAGGRPDLQATNGASLGYLLSLLGDTHAGMAEVEKAMRLHETIGDVVGRGHDLDLIGVLRFRAGDLAGARAALEQAVEAIPREAARVDRAEAMKDLAEVELASGPERRQIGLALLTEARDEFETVGDVQGTVHASILLARAALDAGDVGAARSTLTRMARLTEGRRTAENGWLIRETEGKLLEARGDRDGAVRAYRRAVAEIESLRGGVRSEPWRAAFLEDRVSPYRALLRLHLERGEIEEAWRAARAAKARTLVERLVPPVLDESVPRDDSPPASLLPAPVLAARRLQSLLSERELLLDFFRGDGGWSVFVLSRKGLVHRLLTDSPASIDAVLEAARYPGRPDPNDATVTASWRAACDRLADSLFGDLKELLEGADHLLVVPSGSLHGIPFAGLRVNGRHLVERWSVSVLPAAEALATRARREAGAGAAILAVGDPAGLEGELPGAAEEVHAVASAAAASGSAAVKLLGQEAREAEVRQRAPEFDRIHIAAHGLLDRFTPARSYIALAAGGGEDGRWEAAEIASTRLGASLVVLSGCDTAVELGWAKGEAPADERIGLARAFLAAGAAAVIGGLWEIDDRASRWVMQELYARLSRLAPGAALSSLQKDLLSGRVEGPGGAKLDHPFYWAGLVVYGAGTGLTAPRAARLVSPGSGDGPPVLVGGALPAPR